MSRGAFPTLEVKRQGREAGHSLASKAGVKNVRATCPLPHFSLCRSAEPIKHRDTVISSVSANQLKVITKARAGNCSSVIRSPF
jgi:hypothetical protein